QPRSDFTDLDQSLAQAHSCRLRLGLQRLPPVYQFHRDLPRAGSMKLHFHPAPLRLRRVRRAPVSGNCRGGAFTLPELMVAVAVFSFVVIGVLSANLFGLRMFQLTENKLAANDAARKIIGNVTDDIRNCKTS